MFIAESLAQGLWFLLYYQCLAFIKIPLGYLAIVLCYENPTALVLQDGSLHMHQQIIVEVAIAVGQHITLFLVLVSCRVDQTITSPLSSQPW